MKITISHKHAESRAAVETETSHHLEKLSRLLKPYAPDLVRVHGSFEKHPRKVEYTFSLNLSLPTGTLHSTIISGNESARARRSAPRDRPAIAFSCDAAGLRPARTHARIVGLILRGVAQW
jgi:hypothetical protein